MHEALLYQKLPGKKTKCNVCQRRCLIPNGATGFCKTRINKERKLYTTIYGLISSANNDPIEKKPVFHYKPGSLCFSLGTYGCNFRCKFCQNYDIAYADAYELKTQKSRPPCFARRSGQAKLKTTPEEVIKMANNTNTQGIAFTYNEPAIWLEYSLDCLKLAKDNLTSEESRSLPSHLRGGRMDSSEVNLFTCWVTNGYATKEAIDLIAPYLDIYRVDLKSFEDSFYQKLIGIPKAAGVFETTKYLHDRYPKIHIECVTNIIPGWNDDPETWRNIAKWIKKELGPLTPWHVTGYYPALPNPQLPDYPTPLSTLTAAKKIGQKEGLAFVYLGNVSSETGENTYCPKCQTLNIKRSGYVTEILAVEKKGNRGFCSKCAQDLNLYL